MREEWREKQTITIGIRKIEEIQKLNRLELEYWEGWERSLNGAGRSGNPKFLDGVKGCIQLRCSILGVSDKLSVPVDEDSTQINNTQTNIYLGLPPEIANALKVAGPIWKQQYLEEKKKRENNND